MSKIQIYFKKSEKTKKLIQRIKLKKGSKRVHKSEWNTHDLILLMLKNGESLQSKPRPNYSIDVQTL